MIRNKFVWYLSFFYCFILNINSSIVSISIPKSGTHLLSKCISIIINKKAIYCRDINKLKNDFNARNFYWNHLKFSNLNSEQLYNNIKFLMIRDPRDQIVSMAYWIEKEITERKEFFEKVAQGKITGTNYMIYKDLSFDQRVFKLIYEGSPIYDGFYKLDNKVTNGIVEFYNSYLSWIKSKNICLIKFENLVGAKGGGSSKLQKQEIQKIAKHIGINLADTEIYKIIDQLFGGTNTFKSGQIGTWKKSLNLNNKVAIKNAVGKLLIELGYEKDFNW